MFFAVNVRTKPYTSLQAYTKLKKHFISIIPPASDAECDADFIAGRFAGRNAKRNAKRAVGCAAKKRNAKTEPAPTFAGREFRFQISLLIIIANYCRKCATEKKITSLPTRRLRLLLQHPRCRKER